MKINQLRRDEDEKEEDWILRCSRYRFAPSFNGDFVRVTSQRGELD